MAKIERTCLNCGKVFLAQECYVKKGRGKFCCIGCGTSYRNKTNNPSLKPEVREKISEHHANVSGKNNPMFGRIGEKAPSFRDGLSLIHHRRYRAILLSSDKPRKCIYCGASERLHVHHVDGDHSNNSLNNLEWVCIVCHATKAHHHNRDNLGRFCSCKNN